MNTFFGYGDLGARLIAVWGDFSLRELEAVNVHVIEVIGGFSWQPVKLSDLARQDAEVIVVFVKKQRSGERPADLSNKQRWQSYRKQSVSNSQHGFREVTEAKKSLPARTGRERRCGVALI